ncbi:hypothetical protein BJ508DRAFT_358102 [Ascobolus immersus RN42]|uniref:Mid2 domain-containing protein n=1 Tax=Ascobolus immersus RN42 TaxID=1160509 RepID=A0A3N4IK19_ASCIM|nr:hypothetical protein BJ508DRAFT_358102 [Ascobolus immersus RN42]
MVSLHLCSSTWALLAMQLSLSVSMEPRFIRAHRFYPNTAALQPRQNAFIGGWALRAVQCPADTTRCEATRGVPTCCPRNTVCVREGYNNMPACCAEGDECLTTVQAVPVCANSDWVLWKGGRSGDDPFCCQKGEMGYVTNVSGRFPACGPDDLQLSATQRATTMRPATARAGSPSNTEKPSSPGSTSNEVSSNTSSTSSASTSSDGSSEHARGISTGAIVGIVAGIVIVLAIIAFLVFYIMRTKRKNALLASQLAASTTIGDSPSRTETTHTTHLPPKTMIPSETGWYAPSTVNTELDGRTITNVNPSVPELDGGRRLY